MKKKLPQGGLIGAFGHPMYGFYAFNFAVGWKVKNPEIPLAIVIAHGSLNMLEPYQKEIFDIIIEADEKWVSGIHGKDYMKFKLHLNDITPFEKTLYCDVDMQWCPERSPSDLFLLLKGKQFEIANRGYKVAVNAPASDYDWLPLSQAHAMYKAEKVLDVSSEVIYFEQGKVSDSIFSNAQKVYNDNKLSVRKFSHAVPDEPYLMMGIALSGHEVDYIKWEPSFWQGNYFKDLKKEENVYQFYLISAGGDINHPNTKRIYNNLTGMYHHAYGIKTPYYQIQSKINILKERQKVAA